MRSRGVAVVTGAFGFTGAAIARQLVDSDQEVRTLTNRLPGKDALADVVRTFPLDFQNLDQLAAVLHGASTLYNTYWIRFPRGPLTFDKAVENIRILVKAAERAGVERVVHISVSNPSPDSPLPYFRGKGLAEEIIRGLGMSYAILRPTLIFGSGDILLNNVAWFLRKFPFFPIPGRGDYQVQPVYVEDVASQAVAAGKGKENVVAESAGPDILTYKAMIQLIIKAIGVRSKPVHVPPQMALLLSKAASNLLRDVVLTRDEQKGLMSGLLVAEGSPTGKTRLVEWLEDYGDSLGRRYESEIKRHYLRNSSA